MNRLRLSLTAVTIAAVLAGCTGPGFQPGKPTTAKKQDRVEQLLQQAEGAPPIKAASLKAEAAQYLIAQGRRQDAILILKDVDIALLPPSLRFNIAKLKAEAALERQDSQQALNVLAQMPTTEPLPAAQRIQLSQLRAEAYNQQDDTLAALKELVSIAQLSTPAEQQQWHDQIWITLNKLSDQQLRDTIQSGRASYFEQGWLELEQSLRSATDIASQHQLLAEWKQLWESHPAAATPPTSVAQLIGAKRLQANRIGLLLPQSGKLAKPAQLISDGFMTAYFEAQQSGQPTPQIELIDSTLVTTAQQLQQVITDKQLDLVIGPLDKNYVRTLGSFQFPVPVLALNYSGASNSSNLYQLGLSAEDEARAAAEKIWQDGHRRALIIAPEAIWGERSADAFADQFEALGGLVVGSVSFGNESDYSAPVSKLLTTDKSKERYLQVRKILGQKLEFEERRRKDVQAVFLAARPLDARQIKPTLAFHYAGDVPVYATSQIYSGLANPAGDIDLNQVQFVDIPWVLEPPSRFKLQLSQTRQDTSQRSGRLYALGIDAYNVYPYLQQMQASPQARIKGETGVLHIEQGNGRISRDMPWAVFQEGSPHLAQ